MKRGAVLLCLIGLSCLAPLLEAKATTQLAANPIRKVVSLLQAMQKKVTEEGEAEKALYQKFECYCSKNSGVLSESIAAAGNKVPEVEAAITSAEQEKVQAEADLQQAQADREAAKQAVAEANSIREKEAAAYAAVKAESDTNIQAINQAIAALEKGMSGGFLQSSGATVLRRLVSRSQQIFESDREVLVSFLAATTNSGYSPSSGEVTGILKQLGEEMGNGLAEATATEEAAIKAHKELVAAKEKEIEALTATIEAKTQRIGELGVAVVQMKADLSETQRALVEDRQFLANLESTCANKTEEWKVREQTRAQELAALSETIKLLNDDSALDLFKKTLSSPEPSLLQVSRTSAATRAKALSVLRRAQQAGSSSSAMLDAIVMALHGKATGFEKVIEMIDGMVQLLHQEQSDDEAKKSYCHNEFDSADDKQKTLERAVADAETLIATTQDGLAKLQQEIASLTEGIQQLDKSVAEATEQRKKEHEEYTELVASDSAAKELLGVAKNRLNQFYNPQLYKAPPKKELSREDRIVANLGGASLVQVAAHVQQVQKVAPPPPPETFGAYSKKSEETAGVMEMIDLLVKDLDKELTEAGAEEKEAQKDYEQLMADAAAKRAQDSQLLTEKEGTKATLEGELETHKEAKATNSRELAATLEYIHSLHGECDWLLQHFDVRKEARANEVDSLQKAKAVLSGADYSLVQTRRTAFLSRSSA